MGSYGQQESSSKQQSSSYTPAQKKWQATALETYGPTVGQGQPIYQGPRVADFSPQQAALTNVQGYQDAFNANRSMPLFGETGTAISDAMAGRTGAQPLSVDQANQTFQQTRAVPSYEQFQRFLTPSIQESYAGPGFIGSAKGQAVTQAGTDLAKNLDVQRSSFLWDTENANRQIAQQNADRQLSATQQGMQYGQLPTQEATARLAGQQGAFNLASAEQQQRQAQINATMQQFVEKYRLTDPESLSALLALLGMNYSTSYGTQSGSSFNVGSAFTSTNPGAGGTGGGIRIG
jgi:hypothetical protein